uniref:Uncharacterized protein n=1 Tax=Anguilla anguilla TaxID=7936 RepID=A0A0E9PM24_ANGAN
MYIPAMEVRELVKKNKKKTPNCFLRRSVRVFSFLVFAGKSCIVSFDHVV